MLEAASRNFCHFFGLEHDMRAEKGYARKGRILLLTQVMTLRLLAPACTCCPGRKGLKPESPNQEPVSARFGPQRDFDQMLSCQDSWFCLKVEQYFSLYAVFDGHGSKGQGPFRASDWQRVHLLF